MFGGSGSTSRVGIMRMWWSTREREKTSEQMSSISSSAVSLVTTDCTYSRCKRLKGPCRVRLLVVSREI